MNRAIWVVQGLLAIVFLGAGGVKIVTPTPELLSQMPWVEDLPAGAAKVIGTLELAGAVGLIAPAATKIVPMLTPAAAGGLALTMVGAGLLHIRRGEYPDVIVPLVLLALCLFVVYGRVKSHPISRAGAIEPPASESADGE